MSPSELTRTSDSTATKICLHEVELRCIAEYLKHVPVEGSKERHAAYMQAVMVIQNVFDYAWTPHDQRQLNTLFTRLNKLK